MHVYITEASVINIVYEFSSFFDRHPVQERVSPGSAPSRSTSVLFQFHTSRRRGTCGSWSCAVAAVSCSTPGGAGEDTELVPAMAAVDAAEKRVKELLEKGADISDYINLPEEIRSSSGAAKAILPVLSEWQEDGQEKLFDNFEVLRSSVLPSAMQIIYDRLVAWLLRYEACDPAQNAQHDVLAKELQALFKEVSGSATLKWLKKLRDMDKKVNFLFVLGHIMTLASGGADLAVPWLKKVPVLQTWCQRLVGWSGVGLGGFFGLGRAVLDRQTTTPAHARGS